MAVDGDQLHLRHLEWVGEKKSVRVSACVRMRGTKKKEKNVFCHIFHSSNSPQKISKGEPQNISKGALKAPKNLMLMLRARR